MAGISDEKLQELRDRVDLGQVIGRRVQLKRSGRDLRGLCPFHGEKTPSFYVVPDKRLYHCFGCGKTGDAIRFVMEMEGRSFREAVEQLATEFGVVLEADDPAERQRSARRAALAEVNEKACVFFERVLWEHPKGQVARDHLAKRGVSVETAKAWRLGYAPGLWDSLCKSLQRSKVDPKLIEEAGLGVPRTKGQGRGTLYDRFRGRLIIPIRESGRTVAFGGRLLEGESEAKYLNSPETPLYQKGHTLFALDRAREAVRREGVVLFVEGYFDAIGLHQAGIQTAVATCGTAMTDRHLELVQRAGARELVFLFDGDAAGIRAATRASELAAAAGVPARVLVPPGGEDPDETVARIGTPAFRELLAAAEPSLEFLLDRALAQVGDRASVEARVQVVAAVAGIVAAAPSPLARDLYVEKVAQKLGATADAVRMAIEHAVEHRSAQQQRRPDSAPGRQPERPGAPVAGPRPERSSGGPERQGPAARGGPPDRRGGGEPKRPGPGSQGETRARERTDPRPQGRPTPPAQPVQRQEPKQPRRETPAMELNLVAWMLQSPDLATAADQGGHLASFTHAALRELCERATAAAREGSFDGRGLVASVEGDELRRRLTRLFDDGAAARLQDQEKDPRFAETERKRFVAALVKHTRAAAEEEIRSRKQRSTTVPSTANPDQKTGA